MADKNNGSRSVRRYVLFLEGYSYGPWMGQRLMTEFGDQERYFTRRAWLPDPEYQDHDPDNPPDIWGTADALHEIESGKYHAIVVVDLVDHEEVFFRDFGFHLKKFVEHGGVVAFPACESKLIEELDYLFDMSWERSGYYRYTWCPFEESMSNIHKSFDIMKPYSVKGNTLRNIPPEERCFGVTEESKKLSYYSGGKNSPASDPDTLVAIHDHGLGCICYVGDVNSEDRTLQLVEAFVSSRSSNSPIDCWTEPLPEEVLEDVLEDKEKGNIYFKNGDMESAFVSYQSAVARYNGARGSQGEQRDTLIALHSNSGLVAGKMKKWDKSAACASKALELDPDHTKSLYRRALARFHMSQSDYLTVYNSLKLLRLARKDLMRIPLEDPATKKDQTKLLQRVEHETKRLEKLDKKKKEDDFGEGLKLNATNFRL